MYFNRFKDVNIDSLEVVALSFKEVSKYKPFENTVLIRLGDNITPENMEFELPYEKEYLKVFKFYIPDNRSPKEEYDKIKGIFYNMPSLDDYNKLSMFIKDNKDCRFVIHCSQGESRSSAVAYYICDVKENYDLKERLNELGIYSPNPNLY